MKNVKRNPQRTCMGCNEKKDKKDLIRIVKNKSNEINVDKTGNMEFPTLLRSGGCYILKHWLYRQ